MNLRESIKYVALLLLFLVAGVFWGNYFSLSRSYQEFSAAEMIHIAKVIIGNLAIPMRILSISCVILMIAVLCMHRGKKSEDFYFSAGATLLIITSLVITVAIEVPINNQIISWTPSNLPGNWKDIRDRWQFFNEIRTFAAVISFALFGCALIKK